MRWPAAVLLVFGSCTRDTRPLDTRLSEAISGGLRKHGVKGASVALILSDDSLRCYVSGVSHASVAVKPGMLIAAGSITKNIVAVLVSNRYSPGYCGRPGVQKGSVQTSGSAGADGTVSAAHVMSRTLTISTNFIS